MEISTADLVPAGKLVRMFKNGDYVRYYNERSGWTSDVRKAHFYTEDSSEYKMISNFGSERILWVTSEEINHNIIMCYVSKNRI